MTHLAKSLRKSILVVGVALSLALLSSCSVFLIGPEPWQRDLHAKPSMQYDLLDDDIDDHIYFSKESSSGGRSYGGGGCGCN